MKRLYPKTQIIIQLKEGENGLTVQYGGTRRVDQPNVINKKAVKRDFTAVSG